jgi:hypothetical protein
MAIKLRGQSSLVNIESAYLSERKVPVQPARGARVEIFSHITPIPNLSKIETLKTW